MGILETLLGKIPGEVKFYVFLRDSKVAEVIIEDKDILVDIKNPVLAVEALAKQLAMKEVHSGTLERLKKAGYSVKIKYKGIEFGV